MCHRLGINVQPAPPHEPADETTTEQVFRTLRHQLLERLPGNDVETEAFYYLSELTAIIREWVWIYHHTPHQGLCDPRLPHVELTPTQMFARGMAAAGVLRLPASPDLRMEFLDVAWRTIQPHGVQIGGRRYDGPGLNPYREVEGPYAGAHPGRWPIMVDRDDVRTVSFQDPDTGAWHDLVWEHAPGLDEPFSAETADYTRRLSRQADRPVDPGAALADLLAHLDRRRHQPQVTDDLDVFERYYAEHPDEEMFEVYDD